MYCSNSKFCCFCFYRMYSPFLMAHVCASCYYWERFQEFVWNGPCMQTLVICMISAKRKKHACIVSCEYVDMCLSVCLCVCMSVCVCACSLVRVRADGRKSCIICTFKVHIHIHTCAHIHTTYILTYIHTRTRTNIIPTAPRYTRLLPPAKLDPLDTHAHKSTHMKRTHTPTRTHNLTAIWECF